MSNTSNPTSGYYTPIDRRIYGPVDEHIIFDVNDLYKNMPILVTNNIKRDYFLSLPSYAVSPDLELKEKMYQFIDFVLVNRKDTGALIATTPKHVLKASTSANPVKASGEGDEYLINKIGPVEFDTPLGFTGNINIKSREGLEITIDGNRSFTSKDMEVVLDLIGLKFRDKELVAVAHPTNGNTMWMVDEKSKWSMPITTSELLNQFLNREVK